MAALFCMGMLLYYLIFFRRGRSGASILAKLLWAVYFALGLSALFIALTDVLRPVLEPNYLSALFLLACVLVSISGFLRFRPHHVSEAVRVVPGQGLIEAVLICSQLLAILFFLPFAYSSFTGDAGENRLELASKIELLGSYGLLNTFAGAASQLFGVSLVMALIRLSQPRLTQAAMLRALLLVGASLSYVIYILAYVGRDGVVYWLMTALMVCLVFRPRLSRRARSHILVGGAVVGALLMVPMAAITVARFVDSEFGSAWSVLDYFGSQINNFSDYSSIDRPLTYGVGNFPMFVSGACSLAGIDCPAWGDIREIVFEQYLAQAKEPWLFGTFISDFVGDFGYPATLAILVVYSALCRRACTPRRFTLHRLLLVLFLFLVPYWGVFFFRFSIVNGFIIVNLAFILFVYLLHRINPVFARAAAHSRRQRGAVLPVPQRDVFE